MSKLRITKLNEELVDLLSENVVISDQVNFYVLMNKKGKLYLEDGILPVYDAAFTGDNKKSMIASNLEAYTFFQNYCENKGLEFKEMDLIDLLSNPDLDEHNDIDISQISSIAYYSHETIDFSTKKLFNLLDAIDGYKESMKQLNKFMEKMDKKVTKTIEAEQEIYSVNDKEDPDSQYIMTDEEAKEFASDYEDDDLEDEEIEEDEEYEIE